MKMFQALFQVNRWTRTTALLVLILGAPFLAAADDRGASVVVLFNRNWPESEAVARHYAARRNVPTNQVIGFDLSRDEAMTRKQFVEKLQRPLWQELQSRGLLAYRDAVSLDRKVEDLPLAFSKVRYLVPCYGVPVKILPDANLREDWADTLQEPLRRNEAAVDSELALLPALPLQLPLTGLANNPLFGTTNAAGLNATNGVLITARLDGPTADVARGLVDKAIQAEQLGLWGRAYFDARGLTNTDHLIGDERLLATADIARRFGFETILDKKPEVFPKSFPMSQTALYFGWYEFNPAGNFASGLVEFVPGAIAYHLNSFSAKPLRAAQAGWVGPLLSLGATATIGFTEEPYLHLTPELPILLSRMLNGFTFGEAAYAAQRGLSWQVTVVGDPLYSPFAKAPPQWFADQFVGKSKLIEWSHLLILNRNLVLDTPAAELTTYIDREPAATNSAVLQEKLGDLYRNQGKLSDAIEPYLKALRLEPTSLQRLRLTFQAGNLLTLGGRAREAFDLYEALLRDYPDYPGKVDLYKKLEEAATDLKRPEDAAKYRDLAAKAGKT